MTLGFIGEPPIGYKPREQFFELRRYQEEAVQRWFDHYATGGMSGMLVMPTGTGKQWVGVILANRSGRTLFIAHRDILLEQPMETAKKILNRPSIGLVKAGDNQLHAKNIVFASVQTISREDRLAELLEAHRKSPFQLIVYDECFPAGTLVDGRPIETILVGDSVLAWDEATQTIAPKIVRRVFRTRASSMVRVSIDGQTIHCTANHPFFTTYGWTPAHLLNSCSMVLSYRHEKVPSAKRGLRSVRSVRSDGDAPQSRPQERILFGEEIGSGILHGKVQEDLPIACVIGSDGSHEPTRCVRAHDRQESDETTGDQGEDGGLAAPSGTQTDHSGREWPRDDEGGGKDSWCSECRVETDCGPHAHAEGSRLSVALQDRRGPRDFQDRAGDRWRISQLAGSARAGQAQRGIPTWTRVDSVEVLEPGSDGTFGGVCPEGIVYNLEVDSWHTFLVGNPGIVVHNCHHSSSTSALRVLDALSDVPRVGLTATPVRSDKKGLAKVWGAKPLYRITMRSAIDDGYLVDPIPRPVRIESLDLQRAITRFDDGDFDDAELEKEMLRAKAAESVSDIVAGLVNDEKRKPIVFTVSVNQAARTAELLNQSGVRAASISYLDSKETKKRILKEYRAGNIRVICNAQMLTEGFDDTSVDCIVVARPTFSAGLYCLDDKTEILTKDGWASCFQSDLQKLEVDVASYNTSSGEIRFSKPLAFTTRPVYKDEFFVRYSGPTLDVRVTNKHRMIAKCRKSSKWSVECAEDTMARKDGVVVPVSGIERSDGVPITDDELRFIGWFMTDGTMNKVTKQIIISQAENQPYNADIEKCLIGCGFKYRKSIVMRTNTNFANAQNCYKYTVSYGKPRGTHKDKRGWSSLERYIDKNFSPALEPMSPRQMSVILEAINLGDGLKGTAGVYWTRRTYSICSARKCFVDRLQSLCVRRGFRCNVALHKNVTGSIYMLHVKKGTTRSIGCRTSKDRPVFEREDPIINEIVWCVETIDGTIITRRNGKVAIVGNCQMIGRGLRPHPGKTDCLVVDIVGAHDIAGLITIDNLDMDGETAKRGKREKSQFIDPNGDAEFERLKAFATTATEDIEVRKQKGRGRAEAGRRARVAWIKVTDAFWCLSAGSEGHILMLKEVEEDDASWAGYRLPKESWNLLEKTPITVKRTTQDVITGVCEDKARSLGVFKLSDADALWRKKPPSVDQIRILEAAKIAVPPTSGECADAITIMKMRKMWSSYLVLRKHMAKA